MRSVCRRVGRDEHDIRIVPPKAEQLLLERDEHGYHDGDDETKKHEEEAAAAFGKLELFQQARVLGSEVHHLGPEILHGACERSAVPTLSAQAKLGIGEGETHYAGLLRLQT
mmetsp:Transcript_15988/g.37837  ORF Transcript_15988/g.37837 Transcript_15988/m.37837 type:complete len:112 (+) Transcript_15988:691-1026(+)